MWKQQTSTKASSPKNTPNLPARDTKICWHPLREFVDFKEEFNTAMRSNRIAKPDQLRVLRGALTGHAAQKIPPDYEHTIDAAWAALKENCGKPIRKITYIAKLSDNTSRRHPHKAALWLGNLETSILQFLKLGDRSDFLGMQCFNETIIYNICEHSRTPYITEYATSGTTAERN